MRFMFAGHVLDANRRELRRGAEPVAVEPQVFDLLIFLLENRDRVVSKDDLVAAVWAGRIVSDSTIASRVNAARKAIGDSGEAQLLIRTVARKGFRYVGVVEVDPGRFASTPLRGPPPLDATSRQGLPMPDRPTVAVLPFANMSGEPEQEYFSDGISEDIITGLARLRWFLVTARNSSFIFKGKAAHMREVAEELGVRYVLEGSVRKSGERVRITAQLNDAVTGGHIWAERYDRELGDVFAVQDEITEAIVAAIEPLLYAAEGFRARRKAPDSMDAWDLVMRALSHYWQVTRQDNLDAQALLEKAILIDPNYGQALGLLATSYMFSAHMGWVEAETVTAVAGEAAATAVQADAADPWAHFALGCARLFARRFDDALTELALACELNPSFSLALAYHGLALSYCGRWQEGAAAAERALRLSPRDPLSSLYYGVLAYSRFVGRDYAEAMRLARQAIRQRADFVGAHRVLTAAAGMAGDAEAGAAALEQLRRVQPNVSLAWIALEMPIRDAAESQHYVEGLRRTGLA